MRYISASVLLLAVILLGAVTAPTFVSVRRAIAATTMPRSDERVVACPGASVEQKNGADYVVTGNADGAINQALTDIGANGSVIVVGGTCDVGAPIRLRSRTRLHCDSWGTELRAKSAVDVVTLDSVNVERAHFDHCSVNGNKFIVGGTARGIVIDNTNGTFEYNDPTIVVTDTIVKNTGGDGVWVSARSRATRMDRVRVEKAGGNGFRVNAADSKFDSIESGGAGGYGLDVEGANDIFVNSKFWYSKKSGVFVNGVRNSFAGVEAQDNTGHGFEIVLGKNTFSATQADSNGWSAGTCTAGNQAGYFVDGGSVIIDGIGFDKHEAGRNNGLGCQDYGVIFGSGGSSSTVVGRFVTYGNLAGSFSGTKPTNVLVASSGN